MVATHSRDMQKVSDGGQSPIGRLTHSGRNGSWRSFLEDCRLDRSFTAGTLYLVDPLSRRRAEQSTLLALTSYSTTST